MQYLKLIFIIFLNITFYPFIFLVILISSLWTRKGFKFFFIEFFSKLGWSKAKTFKHSHNESNDKAYIWMHVSSLGEWNTAKIFAKHLIQKTGCPLIVTFFNSDAKDTLYKEIVVCEYLNKNSKVQFLPIENIWAYFRIHQYFRTKALVIVETETWPLLLLFTRLLGKPIFLVNATLFNQEAKRLKRFRWFLKGVMNSFTKIYAVSKETQVNFISLGVQPEKVSVNPNFKYDLLERMPDFSKKGKESDKLQELSRFFETQKHLKRKVLVLASVHLREMKLLIPVLQPLFVDEKISFIIVPRNLNNIDKVQLLFNKNSIEYVLRTEISNQSLNNATPKQLLLDTFGELLFCYHYADLVVMGGTFIPIGGHNFLEALYYNKKVIMGPYFHHFNDFVEHFRNELELTKLTDLLNKIVKNIYSADNIINGREFKKLKNFYGSSVKIADNISENI